MPRFLSPLPPASSRIGPPPVDPGSPSGRRWGEGARSALEYLRHDRLLKDDSEHPQAHGETPGRVRRGR